MILTRILGAQPPFYPYKIPYALRFNDNDSPYLYWAPVSSGNRTTFTFSTWVLRSLTNSSYGPVFNAGDALDNGTTFRFTGSYALHFKHEDNGSLAFNYVTEQVFRDIAGLFHICLEVDTTDSQAADRIKMHINGLRVTDFVTEDQAGSGKETDIGRAVQHRIGRERLDNQGIYTDGLRAETHYVSGLAIGPENFGQFKNGIWIPKEYTGSHGSHGAYLDYADSSDPGKDVSGNDNHWTNNNLTSDDQVVSTPTNNYAVLSSIDYKIANAPTISEGSLKVNTPSDTGVGRATHIIPSSKKIYFEVTLTTISNNPFSIGFRPASQAIEALWAESYDRQFYTRPGHADNGKVWDGSAWSSSYGTPAQGDIIGFAVYDNKLWISINNTWVNSGDPAAGTGYVLDNIPDDAMPCWYDSAASASAVFDYNFGQLGFNYTPPSGFKALCTENLPEPSIKDCSKGFVNKIDTGANIASVLAAARSDWSAYIDVFKNRSATEDWEWIFSDDVTNSIHSNNTDEKGPKQTLVSANNYHGFSIRVGAKYGVYTAEISHTTGSDTDQAHNLAGSKFAAIAKRVSTGGGDWWMKHPVLTASYNIKLNSADAETSIEYVSVDGTNITIMSAAPTGTYRVVVFCDGFIVLSSHDGIGNADGPCKNLNHRPAMLLCKRIDGSAGGVIWSDAINTYNVMDTQLWPYSDVVEQSNTDYEIDFLCTSYKIRGTGTGSNYNGGEYLVISFPSQAVKYANAR